MPPLPLFVFGTLRRGESNHRCLAGAYDRWLPATLRDFRPIVAAHGFPSIIRSPLSRVEGELFFLRPEVYEETMRRCDQLEEVPPATLIGPFYRRMPLTVETSEGRYSTWVYADSSTAG